MNIEVSMYLRKRKQYLKQRATLPLPSSAVHSSKDLPLSFFFGISEYYRKGFPHSNDLFKPQGPLHLRADCQGGRYAPLAPTPSLLERRNRCSTRDTRLNQPSSQPPSSSVRVYCARGQRRLLLLIRQTGITLGKQGVGYWTCAR